MHDASITELSICSRNIILQNVQIWKRWDLFGRQDFTIKWKFHYLYATYQIHQLNFFIEW